MIILEQKYFFALYLSLDIILIAYEIFFYLVERDTYLHGPF